MNNKPKFFSLIIIAVLCAVCVEFFSLCSFAAIKTRYNAKEFLNLICLKTTNAEKVKQALDAGSEWEPDSTFYYVAFTNFNHGIITLLVRDAKKSGIDILSQYGNRTLTQGVFYHNTAVVGELLELGVDPRNSALNNKPIIEYAREMAFGAADHRAEYRLIYDMMLNAARSKSQPKANSSFTANGSITGNKVNVRRKPNTKSKVVKQLNACHPVSITGKNGGWYHIRTASATEGWVFGDYVERK